MEFAPGGNKPARAGHGDEYDVWGATPAAEDESVGFVFVIPYDRRGERISGIVLSTGRAQIDGLIIHMKNDPYHSKNSRCIGSCFAQAMAATLIILIIFPALGVTILMFIGTFFHEARPEPDPDCMARGIARARLGEQYFVIPGDRRFHISGRARSITSLEDYCRYGMNTFIEAENIVFQTTFPELQVDVGTSWPPPVQIFITDSLTVNSSHSDSFSRIAEHISDEDMQIINNQISIDFVGFAIFAAEISVYVATNGRLNTPTGNPLTFHCFPRRSTRPDGGIVGRFCSTSYYLTLSFRLNYRFYDGPYPMDRWIELDRDIRDFVRSMTIPFGP